MTDQPTTLDYRSPTTPADAPPDRINWREELGLLLVYILAGALVGAINGAAISFARINPLIATLGTLSIFRGLAFAFSGGLTQTIPSRGFQFLGRGFVAGVPFPAIVMIVLFAITAWVM